MVRVQRAFVVACALGLIGCGKVQMAESSSVTSEPEVVVMDGPPWGLPVDPTPDTPKPAEDPVVAEQPPKPACDLPPPPKPDESVGAVGRCGFPTYQGELQSCGYPVSSSGSGQGNQYVLSMYNVSSNTHGVGQTRYITPFKVHVKRPDAAPASIDVTLSSYEPTRFVFTGDVAAIRRVYVNGYHCQEVEGVDPARVSNGAYRGHQDTSVVEGLVRKAQSTYEGSCIGTFVVD